MGPLSDAAGTQPQLSLYLARVLADRTICHPCFLHLSLPHLPHVNAAGINMLPLGPQGRCHPSSRSSVLSRQCGEEQVVTARESPRCKLSLQKTCPEGIGVGRLPPTPSPGTWPHTLHQTWKDKTDNRGKQCCLFVDRGVDSEAKGWASDPYWQSGIQVLEPNCTSVSLVIK